MYAVSATALRRGEDGETRTCTIPTFYLYENVQGIVDEDHARRIARRVVDPFGIYDVAMTVVTVVKV